jgi:ferredoxin-NADP reductase
MNAPFIEALLDVRVASLRYAARDTNLVEFSALGGERLPGVEAGAHIDVHLSNGLVRQYSLTNPDSSPRSYVIGVKRDPDSRGGSRFIFDSLRVGDVLKISRPRNNFALDESAENSILIAGGIGITPIWAMSKRLVELKRPWSLYYATRSPEYAAFLDQISETGNAQCHFDDHAPGHFLDLAKIVNKAPLRSHFYCCGPAPMLRAFEKATESVSPEFVHVEYFAPKDPLTFEGGFVVELARSKKEILIPKGSSILSVLREAGINVVSSCEEGVCGSCEVNVISGVPDHRDSILSQAERASGKTMMICCSSSKEGRLVLDL